MATSVDSLPVVRTGTQKMLPHWFAVYQGKKLVRHMLVSGCDIHEAFERVRKKYPTAQIYAVTESDVMQKISDTRQLPRKGNRKILRRLDR